MQRLYNKQKMMKAKRLYLLVLFFVLIVDCHGLTKQQLKNSMKLLRKTCLGKTGVEEDKVQGIIKGIFIEEKEVMCYIACVYQMSQIVKNNKLNYEASLKQVDLMYPNEIKESGKRAIEMCKDTALKYDDLCESSYWTAKCIYESDPKSFIFP